MPSLRNNFHPDTDEQSKDVAEFAQRLQEATDNPTCREARQALFDMISSLYRKYGVDFTNRLFKKEHYGDLFCRYFQSVPDGEQDPAIAKHIMNLWEAAGIRSFQDFENRRGASNATRLRSDHLSWTSCVGLGDSLTYIEHLVNKALKSIKNREDQQLEERSAAAAGGGVGVGAGGGASSLTKGPPLQPNPPQPQQQPSAATAPTAGGKENNLNLNQLSAVLVGAKQQVGGILATLFDRRHNNKSSVPVQQHTAAGENHDDPLAVAHPPLATKNGGVEAALTTQAGKLSPTDGVNNAGGGAPIIPTNNKNKNSHVVETPLRVGGGSDDNHGTNNNNAALALVPQAQAPRIGTNGQVIPMLGNNASVFPPLSLGGLGPSDLNGLNGMFGQLQIGANTPTAAVGHPHFHPIMGAAAAAATNGGGGGGAVFANFAGATFVNNNNNNNNNTPGVVNNSGGVVNINHYSGAATSTTAQEEAALKDVQDQMQRGLDNVQSAIIDAMNDQGGRVHEKLQGLDEIQSTLNHQGATLNDTGDLVREIHGQTTEEHVYPVPQNTKGNPCGHCKAKMLRENSKTAFCNIDGHGSEGFVDYDFGKVLSE